MKAIIFDLDGTLTDTLVDLASSTNYALQSCEMPQRTLDEVRQFVGNGVRNLMLRAVPQGTSDEDFDRCFAAFRQHYVQHCQDNTQLYPGIKELLTELHARQVPMAIVSNKLQAGVDELYQAWFQDTVQVAIGEHPGVQRKPAPDMVLEAMHLLGVRPEDAIYVGDSDVDIQTARNSGLPCLSVLWGFRDRKFLLEHGATTLIENPNEILNYV